MESWCYTESILVVYQNLSYSFYPEKAELVVHSGNVWMNLDIELYILEDGRNPERHWI